MSLGDGEGIVGLNPGKAKADIENINTAVTGLQKTLVTASSSFFGNLSNLWYSPIAMEFGSLVIPMIKEIDDQIISFNDSTIAKCVAAFNRIASAHGTSSISVAAGPYAMGDYPSMKEVGPDGTVGMKVDQVRECMENYISAITGVSGALTSVPSSIAFYDTDGSLVSACQTNIASLRSQIDSAINTIRAKVEPQLTEEATKIEQAAQTAAGQMGGH